MKVSTLDYNVIKDEITLFCSLNDFNTRGLTFNCFHRIHEILSDLQRMSPDNKNVIDYRLRFKLSSNIYFNKYYINSTINDTHIDTVFRQLLKDFAKA